MKKIAVLIDALNFTPDNLEMAAVLAAQGPSEVVGLFIQRQRLESGPSLKNVGGQIYVEEIVLSDEDQKAMAEKLKANEELFADICNRKGITFMIRSIHKDDMDLIVHESRYSDLMLLDPAITFTTDTVVPSGFAIELLNRAECPVLIVPERFNGIEKIVYAWDGSKSSVFAIKQLYYQLPELAKKMVTVFHIKEGRDGSHEMETRLFREWLDMHFATVSYLELEGDASEELYKYFKEHEAENNKLLVTGAFGRNKLSSFFRASTADLVLRGVDIPIFIAHR